MRAAPYSKSVFLNCPFDSAYKPILDAIAFTIYHAGLAPRCALEVDDATENRLDKIVRIIGQCRYGIHDVSRTELDPVNALPRFNMPLELGLFLGAKKFGKPGQRLKNCLILGRELYQHQRFLSDLAGQDVHAHRNDPQAAVGEVRKWLRSVSGNGHIPGGEQIWNRYTVFRQELPEIARATRVRADEMVFSEFATAIEEWLLRNPKS